MIRTETSGYSGYNEKQLAAGHTLSPREQFYYARKLMYHSRYPEAAEKLHDFIENSSGWVENKLEACRDLSACYSALGRTEDAFAALTRALSFSAPSAELSAEYNERAAAFKPESKICRGNREFFSRLFSDRLGTVTAE